MNDLNTHGIDYFEAYITRKKIPPYKYLKYAVAEVDKVSAIERISYAKALEYLVRSMVNCCDGKFKKDVRVWKLKVFQARKPRIELSEYERDLAFEMNRCKELIESGEIDNIDEYRYDTVRKPDRVKTPLPPIEITVAECPIHKKDCRLWLHKTSDVKKRQSAAGQICHWFRDNMDLPSRMTSGGGIPERRIPLNDHGGMNEGGDFQLVTRTRSERKFSYAKRVTSRTRVRPNNFDGCLSNSSSEGDLHTSGHVAATRSHLFCTDNFTKSKEFHSHDSDPEIPQAPPLPKMGRWGEENENANASKTVSDAHQAGPTPTTSSLCTHISTSQCEKLAEAEDYIARERLESDMKLAAAEEYITRERLESDVERRYLSHYQLLPRTQIYMSVYTSRSCESCGHLPLSHQPHTDGVLGELNLNSNLRKRTSSVFSLDGSNSP